MPIHAFSASPILTRDVRFRPTANCALNVRNAARSSHLPWRPNVRFGSWPCQNGLGPKRAMIDRSSRLRDRIVSPRRSLLVTPAAAGGALRAPLASNGLAIGRHAALMAAIRPRRPMMFITRVRL